MGFLRNLGGMLIPSSWELYAILFIAGLFCGGWGVHKLYEADAASQLADTLKTDRGSFGVIRNAGTQFLDEQKRKADGYAKENESLRRRIAAAPKCSTPVPAGWLHPAPGVPDAAGSGLKPRPASPAVEAVADCGAVVLSCEDNRQTVCEPAADQADAIRKLWKDMQKQINGPSHWWQRGK